MYDAIVARLEEHGFTAESAKIDLRCKSGVQSFYLPCTNRDQQEWAFFRRCGTTARELQRYAIDPVLYGKTAVASRPVPTVTLNFASTSNASRDQIDEAVAHLRSLTTGRHGAVFKAAKNLCRLGLSPAEVEFELLQTVGTKSKMRKKVSGALRSATKYRWFSGPQRGSSYVVSSEARPQANTVPN